MTSCEHEALRSKQAKSADWSYEVENCLKWICSACAFVQGHGFAHRNLRKDRPHIGLVVVVGSVENETVLRREGLA